MVRSKVIDDMRRAVSTSVAEPWYVSGVADGTPELDILPKDGTGLVATVPGIGERSQSVARSIVLTRNHISNLLDLAEFANHSLDCPGNPHNTSNHLASFTYRQTGVCTCGYSAALIKLEG